MSALPNELLALICAEVSDNHSLYMLARASRRFLPTVQHILYRKIDLKGRPIRSLRSWCLAVSRNVYLAERVYALSLELPLLAQFEHSDILRVKNALKACVNLKELRLASQPDAYGRVRAESSLHELVSEATFRLTKLADFYFAATWHLDRICARQRDIRILALPLGAVFPADRMESRARKLIGVSALLGSIPTDRPLQRIETVFVADYSRLASFSKTLTTLNIIFNQSTDTPILGRTFNAIAANVSNLLHLALVQTVKQHDEAPLPLPLPLKNEFPRLKTCTLVTRGISIVQAGSTSGALHTFEPNDSLMLLRVAEDTMSACGTLHRLTLGVQGIGYDRTWNCVRQAHGGLDYEEWDWVDFKALSMFWNPDVV
ncbi:hypothetical protein MKEN_00744300 [Mycena kentingensis (nom. inval.)]|nr:hypothetical protein MKEN_00744300 [Mycena kentingensis (nom. inval.)]